MNHTQLKLVDGRVLVAELDPKCRECVEDTQNESEITNNCGLTGRRRRGRAITPLGEVFLCTDEQDLVNSSRKFKTELNGLKRQLSGISKGIALVEERHLSDSRRLSHNITKLNAHIIQEIYALVPQSKMAQCKNNAAQIDLILRKIAESSNEFAKGVLRVLKNAHAIGVEFSVFQQLRDPQGVLNKKRHEIHKVIVNAANTFFTELQEREVTVHVGACTDTVMIDYQTITVALHHLLENAVKYCCPNSVLQISFTSDAKIVTSRWEMLSLYVPEKERAAIMLEGYSSEGARASGNAGAGLGLFISKTLVDRNDGQLELKFGSPLSSINSNAYSKNEYILKLPK